MKKGVSCLIVRVVYYFSELKIPLFSSKIMRDAHVGTIVAFPRILDRNGGSLNRNWRRSFHSSSTDYGLCLLACQCRRNLPHHNSLHSLSGHIELFKTKANILQDWRVTCRGDRTWWDVRGIFDHGNSCKIVRRLLRILYDRICCLADVS